MTEATGEADLPIREGIKDRREALRGGRAEISDDAPAWGLALSGGGLRSATFSLGVLSALAKNERLLRFDLLSSVSGGGYVAATLCGLFSRSASLQRTKAESDAPAVQSSTALEVQTAFGDSGKRPFESWLRANGRYLSPGGGFDLLYTCSVYLRNLITVHLELAAVALLLGIGLTTFNIIAWAVVIFLGYQFGPAAFDVLRYLPHWLPSLALILIPASLLIVSLSIAYWIVQKDRPRRGSRLFRRHLLALIFAVSLMAWKLETDVATTVGQSARAVVQWSIGGLLAVVTFAWSFAWFARRQDTSSPGGHGLAHQLTSVGTATSEGGDPSYLSGGASARSAQHRLTVYLARVIQLSCWILALGLIDRVAWFFAFEIPPDSQFKAGLLLAVVAALSRALIPQVSGRFPPGLISDWLIRLGSALGYLLIFLLCAWWVSVVQKMALGAAFQRYTPNFESSAQVLLVIAIMIVVYYLVTGTSVRVLNGSSLHNFYRDRLIFSFIGATNPIRFSGSPLERPTTASGSTAGRERNWIEADDLQMSRYRPQSCGGPVHLINVCLNQRFNAGANPNLIDRKGGHLQISSTGHVSTRLRDWEDLGTQPRFDRLSLGSWIAISGAAIAPGMGRISRRGLSALAAVSGLRLGYWCHRHDPDKEPERRARHWKIRLRQLLPARSSAMLRESFGVFSAGRMDDWYLSDGGHFENTGAYALLAQRAGLIVLVDGGADPNYDFRDLEKLVRKARIDLQAEILFQRPKADPSISVSDSLREALKIFGSVNDIESPDKSACLTLARINYQGNHASPGLLLVIKPAMTEGLPLDLVNFKARFKRFPQESTRDQFFSEAQWESYFQLGRSLGGQLTKELLDELPEKWESWFEADDKSPFGMDARAGSTLILDSSLEGRHARAFAVGSSERAADSDAIRQSDSRLPARIRHAAVGASLGLGAIATVSLAVSSTLDNLRASSQARAGEEGAALKELTRLWAALPPASGSLERSTDSGQQAGVPSTVSTQGAKASAASHLAAAILQTAETLCRPGEVSWLQRSAVARQIYVDALEACHLAPGRHGSCEGLLRASRSSVQSEFPMCLWLPFPDVTGGSPPPRYWAFNYSFDAPFAHAHPCDPVASNRRAASRNRLQQPSGAAAGLVPPSEIQTSAFDPIRHCESPSRWEGRLEMAFGGTGAFTHFIARGEDGPGCEAHSIYIQVQGSADLPVANLLRERWLMLGASIPPVENTTETARAERRPVVAPVSVTTIRTHDNKALACAELLKGASEALVLPSGQSWRTESVASSQRKAPKVIEVWIAPEELKDGRTQSASSRTGH